MAASVRDRLKPVPRLLLLGSSFRYLRMDSLLGCPQPAAVAVGADGEDLREDRERRLGLGLGADVEAARPRDALELLLGDARLEQPLAAALLVSARAERTDIEGLRAKRALKCRLVELVVVSEDDDRRRVVGLHLRERLVGPRDDQLVGARDALLRRELGARVGDDRVPAEELRGRAERLGRIDRAVDEKAGRRCIDLGIDAQAPCLEDPVAVAADQLVRLRDELPGHALPEPLAVLDREHVRAERLALDYREEDSALVALDGLQQTLG